MYLSFCIYVCIALELKVGDSVLDAIRKLYENDLFGAPIVDAFDLNAPCMEFSCPYIGFLDFSTMVLWCIQVVLCYLLGPFLMFLMFDKRCGIL